MTKKKDTAPEAQAAEQPVAEAPAPQLSATVTVLGPDGPVYLAPEPIHFVDGKAEMAPDLADILVSDKAAPGRYTLEG